MDRQCRLRLGDRFVAGLWEQSPIGPMCDVMWARSDGERVLLVPTPEIGRFVSAVYRFDRVAQVSMDWAWSGRRLHLTAGALELDLHTKATWGFP